MGLARLPLRTQLPAVFAALLAVGLLLTGISAFTLLRQSLLTEVDDQLAQAVPTVLEQATGGMRRGARSDGPPSDYEVRIAAVDGTVLTRWSASTGGDSVPTLPTWTATEAAALDGEPYTVRSDGSVRWRAVTRALAADGELVGSVTLALPLTAVDATLQRMRLVLGVVGVLVVGGGAFAGWWAVRRSLRPLGEIEETAAAIAGGDLTRRVPDAPTSTEVGRLAAALNGMLTQVERAFAERTASEERMRRFVADASHELRTPLATIRGYGELYRMGALTGPEEPAQTLQRIEDSATRMGTLVEDLLHLARLDAGRSLRSEPVDLAVLATDAAADLRALDPARPVQVVPVVPGGSLGGAVTRGDEDRLRQVVANLVGNVVQHTPAGTPVEVAVGRCAVDGGAHAVLEVRDHGPGIPPEHVDRVFERFYRVDAARGRTSGGSGLGMAIVAAIVDAHGGRVGVLSTAGGGTTVRVALPLASPVRADASASAPDYDDEALPPRR